MMMVFHVAQVLLRGSEAVEEITALVISCVTVK